MTHDELLAKIDDSTNGLKHKDLFPLLLRNTEALLSVVEFHKTKAGKKFCTACGKFFPCPTIEIIKGELQ